MTKEHSKEAEDSKPDPKPDPKIKKRIKRMNWLRIGICAGIIAAVIILFLALKSPIIQSGIAVKLQYSLALANGTVIANGTSDFNVGSISKNFGFLSNKTDSALLGLKRGNEIKINLSANESFGQRNENLVYSINRVVDKSNRTNEMNRTISITNNQFGDAFNATPVINKIYPSPITGDPFNYTVVNFDSANVTLRIEAALGELPSRTPGVTQEIISIDNKIIKIKTTLNSTQTLPFEGGSITISQDGDYIITTLTPERGKELSNAIPGYKGGKVVSFNDTSIIIDGNNEFAGQDLVLEVKVLSVKEPSITGKAVNGMKSNSGPTMQVFVMSYCPYGLQMLKGLLPAWKLLQEKANFELRFVSYTMHGAKEEEENKRMICIREEQNDKLIDYLECFVESGDANSCISEANIDKSSLQSCMSSKAPQYMEEDKNLNKQYGVRGSPTVIIEGKTVQISRDPESVKQAICDAFASPPSECSQKLSSSSPSPGFGSGTSSSSGSCS